MVKCTPALVIARAYLHPDHRILTLALAVAVTAPPPPAYDGNLPPASLLRASNWNSRAADTECF